MHATARDDRRFSVRIPTLPRSSRHQRIAHELIPGGAHTYAKGDDQYAANLAPVITRGQGCRVWGLDGEEYIELGAGVRSVTLGHAYPRVCQAAQDALWQGTNFARPAAVELDAARTFLDCVGWADMVKFAKNGSDATTAAVRLSRVVTGRDTVAVCRDQPFFSVDDWFIAETPMRAGIPQAIADLTTTFPFNDAAALERLFREQGDRIACIILEPERDSVPAPGYLAEVRRLCDRYGIILIADETISGFRLHPGGACTLHGLVPDLATFGKGMANGFSVSALAGRRDLMERGGLRTRDERVFLLSTTHGGETHALAAAMATMDEIARHDVCTYLAEAGTFLRNGLEDAARSAGVDGYFTCEGHPANLIYATRDAQGQRCQKMRTVLLQETVRRGVIAPNLVVHYQHDEQALQTTIDGFADALKVYKRALDDGPESVLEGRPVKPVFRTFN